MQAATVPRTKRMRRAKIDVGRPVIGIRELRSKASEIVCLLPTSWQRSRSGDFVGILLARGTNNPQNIKLSVPTELG